ncbi:hypothetical protein IIA16_02735 [bacterium]|nr:hypothetical protein [bacterium]
MHKYLPLLLIALLAACDAGGAQSVPTSAEAVGHARALSPLGAGVLLRLAPPAEGAGWDISYTLQAGPGTGEPGPFALRLEGGHTVRVAPAPATGPGEVGLDFWRENISLEMLFTDEEGNESDPLSLLRMATGHDPRDILAAMEGVRVRLSFTPRAALRDISNLDALMTAIMAAAGADEEDIAQAMGDMPDLRAELATLREAALAAGADSALPLLGGYFPEEPVTETTTIGWTLAQIFAMVAPDEAADIGLPDFSWRLVPAGLRDGGLVFDLVVEGTISEADVTVTIGGGGEVVLDLATGLPRRADVTITILMESTASSANPFTFPVEATLLISPSSL